MGCPLRMSHPAPVHSFRYLPEAPEETAWGVRILDVGGGAIGPGAAYPSSEHPEEYRFTWERGRRIDEYQIVFISAGRGAFESGATGRQTIAAPTGFILFPGTWHRYRPHPKSGWTEHWIGFKGDYASSLMQAIADPLDAVFKPDSAEELQAIMDRVRAALSADRASSRVAAIAETLAAVALLQRSLSPISRSPDEGKIAQARQTVLARCGERLDWKQLSRELGMSHQTFRRRFREVTGMPPFRYQREIRFNRAKALLSAGRSVTEVSDLLGFSSPFHFSRAFRARVGQAPTQWRDGAANR